MLGVDSINYSSHSISKTKPTVIYEKTKNIDAVRRLLGHSSVIVEKNIGVNDRSIQDFEKNNKIYA